MTHLLYKAEMILSMKVHFSDSSVNHALIAIAQEELLKQAYPVQVGQIDRIDEAFYSMIEC